MVEAAASFQSSSPHSGPAWPKSKDHSPLSERMEKEYCSCWRTVSWTFFRRELISWYVASHIPRIALHAWMPDALPIAQGQESPAYGNFSSLDILGVFRQYRGRATFVCRFGEENGNGALDVGVSLRTAWPEKLADARGNSIALPLSELMVHARVSRPWGSVSSSESEHMREFMEREDEFVLASPPPELTSASMYAFEDNRIIELPD